MLFFFILYMYTSFHSLKVNSPTEGSTVNLTLVSIIDTKVRFTVEPSAGESTVDLWKDAI